MKRIIRYIPLLFLTSAFAQLQEHVIPLTTNDIVYDAVTDRIYASVPSANGNNGNSIGIINPHTYTLENTVFIGSEPTVLAIADNGQYIYAGFAGSATVRRFDVAAQTAGLQFPLGSDSFLGPYYAADIEVVPGNANAIVVSRKYTSVTPEFAGVALYQDGVMAPNVVEWAGGEISNHIEFKNSGVLFGYNNETTGFDFNRMAVNAGGVTLVANTGNMPDGYSFDMNFMYHDNHAYFTDGTVLDVTGVPYVLGEFPAATGPAAYDVANNYVCYGHSANGSIIFKRFNPQTFLLHDSMPITEAFGQAKNIITCGEGCYALNTTDNNVIILRDETAGVAENAVAEISLYPNPASDYITLSAGNAAITSAGIYSVNGSLVAERPVKDSRLQVQDLAQGIYLVKMIDENDNSYTKKFIKI